MGTVTNVYETRLPKIQQTDNKNRFKQADTDSRGGSNRHDIIHDSVWDCPHYYNRRIR